MDKKKLIIYSFVLISSILIYRNRKKIIAFINQGVVSSSEHLKIQSKINNLISYYGTPRGSQTGCGCGVDLFVMTKNYGQEGVKKFIYSIAKFDTNPFSEKKSFGGLLSNLTSGYSENNIYTKGYEGFDYSLYDNWLKTGVYQEYLKCENRKGFNVKTLLATALKVAPIVAFL